MARKKTITREHILSAVYDVVSTEGFSGFTARNIACKMKSSTQPIYLEFKNMDELRDTFINRIINYFRTSVYDKDITGDPIVDVVLCYVEFAKHKKTLFRALFVDKQENSEQLNTFIRELFMEKLAMDSSYNQLSEEEKETLFVNVLMVATGIASLTSAERINPSQEEITAMIKNMIGLSKQMPAVSIGVI